MMSKRNSRCLTANQVELVDRLHCQDVLMFMESAGIVNARQKNSIENGNTGQLNERFLQWLGKAPEGTYHDFVAILRQTNQSHLARLLIDWDENTPSQNTCKPATTTTATVRRKRSTEEEHRREDISTPGRPDFI